MEEKKTRSSYRKKQRNSNKRKKIIFLITIVILFLVFGVIVFKRNEAKRKNTTLNNINHVENDISNAKENQKLKSEENTNLAYEDFIGTYVNFEGEPYNSQINNNYIITITEDEFEYTDRWEDHRVLKILEKEIINNILIIEIEYYADLYNERDLKREKVQFELKYDESKKYLLSKSTNSKFYSLSNEDLNDFYEQKEIDYARIIMTIMGEMSLDAWHIKPKEFGPHEVFVSYSKENDSTQISDDVLFPENVTHLVTQIMGAQVDETTITYSSIKNGYIKIYQIPLAYGGSIESEEHAREIANKAINNPIEKFIEPFDPYTVADFIAHVDFVYE